MDITILSIYHQIIIIVDDYYEFKMQLNNQMDYYLLITFNYQSITFKYDQLSPNNTILSIYHQIMIIIYD